MENTFKHGAFCWNELATPDVEGAKKFYGAIFGWKFVERDMGPMVYNMVEVNGMGVGGIMPACPGQPALWGSYVSVDNADETARLATENGGGSSWAPPIFRKWAAWWC